MGGTNADGNRLGVGNAKHPLHMAGGGLSVFGIHQDIDMRGTQPGQIMRRRIKRGHDIDADAHLVEQALDLFDIVAMAKAQRERADQVRSEMGRFLDGAGQGLHQLVKGLVRAEIFLALITGQFQRDDRHGKVHRLGQATGIILDQLGRAGGPDDQRLGLKAIKGILASALEQAGRILAQIASFECCVADRRAMAAPLDHGEKQISIGIALRRVQHIMQTLHRGRDTHRADMRRALICPDGQLHGCIRGLCPRTPGIFKKQRRGAVILQPPASKARGGGSGG